ncbi:MAG: type I asparaginase [Salibacteraceae bacterium]
MSSILIIYTGGTIGMVESDDRKTLVPFDLRHILAHVPELKKLKMNLEAISFPEPIDSSDMQPDHWTALATIIRDHYTQYDGFVILHGSDTLAFTASALSFMLTGLSKPVIITGSQLPIGMIRTDARENLITAVEMAGMRQGNEPVIQEVAVYFEYKLYRGNRTTKVSAEAFQAFDSPNYPVLAEAGVHIEVNHDKLWRSDEDFQAAVQVERGVGHLSVFPGMMPSQVEAVLADEALRAVVLHTFGSGNASRQSWFLRAINAAVDRGVVVLNITQCLKGRVEQGKYETSRALQEMGVVSGGDMTLEAALTKLMHLLAVEPDDDHLRKRLISNIRGELTV